MRATREENVHTEENTEHRKGFEHTATVDALHIWIHEEQCRYNQASLVAVKLTSEEHEQHRCARRKEDVQVTHRQECRKWICVSESSELDIDGFDQKIGRGMPQEHTMVYCETGTARQVFADQKIHTLI